MAKKYYDEHGREIKRNKALGCLQWFVGVFFLMLAVIIFASFIDTGTTKIADNTNVSPEVQKSIDEKYEFESEVDYAISLVNDRIGGQNGLSRYKIIQFLESKEYDEKVIQSVLENYNASWDSLAVHYILNANMEHSSEQEIVELLERQMFKDEEIEYALSNIN